MTVLELIGVILMCALLSVFIYLRKEIAIAIAIKNAVEVELDPQAELFRRNEAEIARWRKENGND